jgi:sucrose-6-phosphate hydrolase SacC (GH32 family)
MAVTLDASLVKWEDKRYRVTDKDTFKNKIDKINNEKVSNRYDMRDPIVFKRDGKYFMIIAGTAIPGRKGQGIISILRPGNPQDLSKPWVYIGDMFRHPQSTIEEGGPGILETPNLQRVGDKDIVFFGAQRREDEGPLKGFHHREGIQYFVGKFDSNTGKFTADSDIPQYFEYGRAFYAVNATATPLLTGEKEATFVGWIKGHNARADWGDVENRGWNGALTFPRTMKWVNGHLVTGFDGRLNKLHQKEFETKSLLSLNSDYHVTKVKGRSLHLKLGLSVQSQTEAKNAAKAKINLLADINQPNKSVAVVFNGKSICVIDECLPVQKKDRFHNQKKIEVEILLDRSVIVIFAEGRSLTKVITPPRNEKGVLLDGVTLQALNGTAIFTNFKAYSLE